MLFHSITDSQRISAFILTADGSVRSPNLVKTLTDRGFQPQLIRGYSRNSYLLAYPKLFSETITSTFLNRNLSSGEVAAILTHRRAHLTAIGRGRVVFLEDDAILGVDFSFENLSKFFELLERHAESRIFSLYPNEWSVFFKSNNLTCNNFKLLKAIYPPAGAIGYLMSNSALKEATQYDLNFNLPADWPDWSRKVKFYGAVGNFINLDPDPNSSIIGVRPGTRLKLSFLISPKILRHMNWKIKYQLIYPLIWKVAIILGKPILETLQEETESISRIFPL
jgi:GR25 family glycosyltransferase involved in LPS biosynthesis